MLGDYSRVEISFEYYYERTGKNYTIMQYTFYLTPLQSFFFAKGNNLSIFNGFVEVLVMHAYTHTRLILNLNMANYHF